MATPGRPENTALARWPIADLLEGEPYLFEFFQAIRLMARMAPERQVVGRFSKPASEVVRLGSNPAVGFPASQIQSLERRGEGPPVMRVNFLGLHGPLGVLPRAYCELVNERMRAHDTTLRDFFDLFNHRILSLFYQAWEKYRFAIDYERGGPDKFAHHLLDFIGLGTEGLENRQKVADHSLVYYAGLLGQHPRSAVALRQLLEDYFDVPVAIQQFAGAWYKLTPEMQCCLDREPSDSERVAVGATVGDEIWDEQTRVRIVLGPLPLDRYLDFLPTGTAFEPLRALARFFSGDELDFEVQLVLQRHQVPACELGREDAEGPLLGWVSWAKSAPLGRDPGDTLLEL